MERLKYPENYYIRVLLNKVTLREIMVTKVIAAKIEDKVSAVERAMRERNIRHMPIVDHQNILVGIITQRDIFRIQSPRRDEDGNWFYDSQLLDEYILSHIMTKNPFTLRPEDSVATALIAMYERKYGCIPVISEYHELSGIVTQTDILGMAVRILKES